jgi:hypothetical protein
MMLNDSEILVISYCLIPDTTIPPVLLLWFSVVFAAKVDEDWIEAIISTKCLLKLFREDNNN